MSIYSYIGIRCLKRLILSGVGIATKSWKYMEGCVVKVTGGCYRHSLETAMLDVLQGT